MLVFHTRTAQARVAKDGGEPGIAIATFSPVECGVLIAVCRPCVCIASHPLCASKFMIGR